MRISRLVGSEYGKDVTIFGAVYGFTDMSINRTLQYFQVEYHEGGSPPDNEFNWYPIADPVFSEKGSEVHDDILAVWRVGRNDYAPRPGIYTLHIVVQYHTLQGGKTPFKLPEKCWARINLK